MKHPVILFLFLAGLALGRPAWAAPEIRVGGDVARAGTWSGERLLKEAAGSVKTVRYTMRGEQHSARAVPLLALVEAAGPRFDPARKGHRLGFVVVVRARDGYAVTFGLGELLPDAGARPVWLALEVDGKALPENEAPARLVIPGEGGEHYHRWLYGIESVTVLDGSKLGTDR